MGTRRSWRIAAVVAVVVAVGAVAGHPWSAWTSDHEVLARACNEDRTRSPAWPDAEDLRSTAQPSEIVLCRWQRVHVSENRPVSTTRLGGARRDEVMAALRRLRPHDPQVEPVEGFEDHFSLELRGPDQSWWVEVPRDPRMGVLLNDGGAGAWYSTGGLPRVLDRWVER